mgnify:CR=1 FL=1
MVFAIGGPTKPTVSVQAFRGEPHLISLTKQLPQGHVGRVAGKVVGKFANWRGIHVVRPSKTVRVFLTNGQFR